MLIQRRSSCSTISTWGSVGAVTTGALERGERRRRGRGILGIASEGVVLHSRRHLFQSTSGAGHLAITPPNRHSRTAIPNSEKHARLRPWATGKDAEGDDRGGCLAHTPRFRRACGRGLLRVRGGAGPGRRAAGVRRGLQLRHAGGGGGQGGEPNR